MSVDGRPVAYGIGTHARSVIEFDLPKGYARFQTFAGLDDGGTSQMNVEGSTVQFLVFTRSPYFEPNSKVEVSAEELGFKRPVTVRDLWQHKELGRFDSTFAAEIPSHGAGLYRVRSE